MKKASKRKKQSPHELIFLLKDGFKQKDLINFGYAPATVNRYAKYYEKAMKKYNEVVNKAMEIKTKEDSKHFEFVEKKKNGFAQEIVIKEKKDVEEK
jgi:hypothetical protein